MSPIAPSIATRCCRHLAARTQKHTLPSYPSSASRCLRSLSSTSSNNNAGAQRRRNNEHRNTIQQPRRRWQSTDAAAAPTNPKIAGIVDQISQLTLLETADLVASLKTRLNIPDISFAAPASSGSAGGAAAGAPAAAAEAEDEPAPAAQEKTLFTLKLESFDAASKPKIIKEVKSMLGLSLVDSKKFVESAPKVLKEGVTKEEGQKIVELLKGLGGVVSMD